MLLGEIKISIFTDFLEKFNVGLYETVYYIHNRHDASTFKNARKFH